MRLAPLALLVGCSATPIDTDPVATGPRWSTHGDTDPTIDTDSTTVPATAELTGTVPGSPLPPPTFASVRNLDGAARTPADLVGHPTVMWFYPAAGTGG